MIVHFLFVSAFFFVYGWLPVLDVDCVSSFGVSMCARMSVNIWDVSRFVAHTTAHCLYRLKLVPLKCDVSACYQNCWCCFDFFCSLPPFTLSTSFERVQSQQTKINPRRSANPNLYTYTSANIYTPPAFSFVCQCHEIFCLRRYLRLCLYPNLNPDLHRCRRLASSLFLPLLLLHLILLLLLQFFDRLGIRILLPLVLAFCTLHPAPYTLRVHLRVALVLALSLSLAIMLSLRIICLFRLFPCSLVLLFSCSHVLQLYGYPVRLIALSCILLFASSPSPCPSPFCSSSS